MIAAQLESTLRRVVAVAVVAVLALAGPLAAVARADVVLVASNPGHDSTVGGIVDRVLLRYDREIRSDAAFIDLIGPDGREQAAEGPIEVGEKTLAQRFAPITVEGRYTVRYQVFASDGHLLTGRLHFTHEQGAPPPSERKASGSDTGAAPRTKNIVVWGGIVGLVLVGIVIMVSRRRDDRPAR